MSEKILVVGPAWVGDMMMAQSLFKLLKLRHPDADIDVVAPAWTEPLLARMPEVHEAILLQVGHGQLRLGLRIGLGWRLRERRYDWAIVLPRSYKSAIVPFLARARRRTGFLGEWRWGLLNDIRELDREALPRNVDRFHVLGLEPGEPLPAETPLPRLEAKSADAALANLGLQRPEGPALGMCPGAEYGPTKRWPAEYFTEVANSRLDAGWQVWLFGSEKDAPITRQINALTGDRCLDLGGRTRLAEVIDLMALMTQVVTNDSGLMHVAAAVDRPLVAVYGSTATGFTPPLHPKAKIVSLNMPCCPCNKRECPFGHLKCLRDIQPEQVLAAMAAQH